MRLFAPGIFSQPATKDASGDDEDIGALKAQLAALQRQIDKLDKG
jgi:polyhydroxyalkanoate synthesis regulator protein